MAVSDCTEEDSWIMTLYHAASTCTYFGNEVRTKYHDMWTRHLFKPNESAVSYFAAQILSAAQLTLYFPIGALTAYPGIYLRDRARKMQGDAPFTSSKGTFPIKTLPEDRKIRIKSWNIAGARAGYNYTDAGVTNLEERIDAIVATIIEQIENDDVDVVCLYEMYDTTTSKIIVDKLKEHFGDIYWNSGKRGLGAPAGIAVFSKYEIQNPEFLEFPDDTLAGRTKGHATKGAFRFEIMSEGKSIARMLATHPIHSEEPAFPTEEEETGRAKQMQLLHQWAMEKSQDELCTIVMGDRNCDTEEYNSFEEWKNFTSNNLWRDEQKTWGGDKNCVDYINWQPISNTLLRKSPEKRVSKPLDLDFIVALQDTYETFETRMVDVGFDGTEFKEKALSDHNCLTATVVLNAQDQNI